MENTGPVDILLVEDNQQHVELTLRALKKSNPTDNVHVVGDGAEALDFVFCQGSYAQRNIENAPRVIFLDLKLPKVDGLEVLRRIKSHAQTQTIPVVVLTTSQQESDLMESYRLGVNSYVVKPVKFERFMQTVADVGSYWVSLNQAPSG